ncbi:hypothetical protein HDZ31DRAFT_69818, partial [Schizophyllum fasciatum]
PNELVDLFCKSPKVGLNFAKIFDFDEGETDDEDEEEDARLSSGSARSSEHRNSPPSPTSGKERPRPVRKQSEDRPRTSATAPRPATTQRAGGTTSAPPTRLRRPSIRGSSRRPTIPGRSEKTETLSSSVSDPVTLSASAAVATSSAGKASSSGNSSSSGTSSSAGTTSSAPARKVKAPPVISRAATAPAPPTPRYDMRDEENLPSPFLKRVDRTGQGKGLSKRPSGGNMLRAVAAANSARRGSLPSAGHGLAPGIASASAPAVAGAAEAR